ncbi:MAG: hypothetical protein RLO51_20445 [Thalassobaculum sp.]|uniref:hypothetical protein n=1 Tax=Thalassobaculum sp. TaxID=2022740 RepID=UPI0032EFE722
MASLDQITLDLIRDTYLETAEETLERGGSKLKAHMEGTVAAAMYVAAAIGIEDEEAKRLVVQVVRSDAEMAL